MHRDFFSKISKGKNSLDIVQEQIEKAQNEVYYFEGLLQQVETASPKDIAEIREELIEEGYIQEQTKKTIKKENTKCKTHFGSFLCF